MSQTVLENRDAFCPTETVRAEVSARRSQPQHILTINLEDWFHVGAFHHLIDREQWYRFEPRLERSVQTTLEVLRETQSHATFFVLGWVAEQMPELVRRIVADGHEVANRGFYHRNVRELTREEFRDDLLRAQEQIEHAANNDRRVTGYRIADGWIGPADEWALDVLAEQGYVYDASVLPGQRFEQQTSSRQLYEHNTAHGRLIELPPSSWRIAGKNIPLGGNWLRQLPGPLVRHAIRRWEQTTDQPLVTYFHVWELDPEQPQISAAGRFARLRHYRHLDRMRGMIEEQLRSRSFGTVSDVLHIPARQAISTADIGEPGSKTTDSASPQPAVATAHADASHSSTSSTSATPVSIVIPCFNEEDSLPALSRTLDRLKFELAPRYAAQFVLVDDRSRDSTWELMRTLFGSSSETFKLVRHEQNQGVSAAIYTGIRHADADVVCSIDCDCSYDPLELRRMLPLMTEGVDLVTASPYHPQGRVKNVPGWRLLLSKTLSRIYRTILPARLHTWTSCFRVYRRSTVLQLPLKETGFLGTAELVGQLALRGATIVEHPATLEVRIFGESKMKTWRTIRGHLRLVRQFLAQRWRENRESKAGPDQSASSHSTN